MPSWATIILSPRAVRDRDVVVQYLVDHHAMDAAIRFLDHLDDTLRGLAEMPLSGRIYVDLYDVTVRKANIRDFPERVFYTWDGDAAYITRITSPVRRLLPEDLVAE